MIDREDYAEPACSLCGGKEFYNPKKDAPIGRIPVGRIIDRVDSLFNKNDYQEAGRLLEYWKNEAVSLKDKNGELAIESELVGFYRKQNDSKKGLESIARALSLVEELEQGEMASGGTVFINCATAYKAFGLAEKALPLYIRAEAIYKKTLKEDDARFGGLYNNMAITLVGLEKYQEAEVAYKNALSVMQQVGGEAECAITHVNLAHMYEILDRGEEATCSMKKAYSLLKSPNLNRDGYYAFVLEKCVQSFAHFGFTTESEEMKKEAEKIYAGA